MKNTKMSTESLHFMTDLQNFPRKKIQVDFSEVDTEEIDE